MREPGKEPGPAGEGRRQPGREPGLPLEREGARPVAHWSWACNTEGRVRFAQVPRRQITVVLSRMFSTK